MFKSDITKRRVLFTIFLAAMVPLLVLSLPALVLLALSLLIRILARLLIFVSLRGISDFMEIGVSVCFDMADSWMSELVDYEARFIRWVFFLIYPE